MKKVIVSLMLFWVLSLSAAYSQDLVADSLDRKAFPDYDFEYELIEKAVVPIWEDGANISGRMSFYFTVDEVGEIHDVKIIKGIAPIIDKAVADSIYKMPKWQPAEYKGVKVPSMVYFTFRVIQR